MTAICRARRREIRTGSDMAREPSEPTTPVARTSPRSNVRKVRIDDPGADTALMTAFVGREERAAGVLYDRLSSRIYGLGIVMLGTDQAAQDLVQDTFVKLWRTAARFDAERGRLETW